MPFTYEFTQYNAPGPGQAGGVKDTWRYTSDVVPYTDGSGNVFTPAIISHDAMTVSQENNSGQIYVQCARDFPVALLYYRAVPSGSIWLRVRDQVTGLIGYVGRIRSCEWAEVTAKFLMSSSSDMLARDGLRIHWEGPCGWQLYGPRCGVNRNAQNAAGSYLYRTDGSVDSVSADGLTVVSSAFATRPDGFFSAGSFVVGDYHRMILSHAGNTVTLMSAIDGLAAGTAFSSAKGCNRSTGSSGPGGCADFQNITFFGGTPNVPLKNIFASGVADGTS
ncbi:Phage conserved hypothetical protein BR0599 [Burkholderia sp. YR290]|nr:Phage conserved hypothetical protein BR0599 [Burkholderia sp. YR290]